MVPQAQIVEENGLFRKPLDLYLRLKEETLDIAVVDEQKNSKSSKRQRSSSFSKIYDHLNETLRLEEEMFSPAKKTPKKQVRFQLEDDQDDNSDVKVSIMGPLLVPSSEMTDVEKSEVWWQTSDYKSFSRSIKKISTEIFHRENENKRITSYSSVLKRTYQACCSRPRDDDSVELSPLVKKQLENWIQVSAKSRGLEYVSIPLLVAARRKNRDTCISAVLELQEKMNQTDIYDYDMKTKTLQCISERKSQSTRLFSQLLGEADAEAVRNDVEHSSAQTCIPRRWTAPVC